MDKVYEVTVTLHVYGQTSKQAALDWLDEALEVDGLIVEKKSAATLLPAPVGSHKAGT